MDRANHGHLGTGVRGDVTGEDSLAILWRALSAGIGRGGIFSGHHPLSYLLVSGAPARAHGCNIYVGDPAVGNSSEGRSPDSSCNIWRATRDGPAGSGFSCSKLCPHFSLASRRSFISTAEFAGQNGSQTTRKKLLERNIAADSREKIEHPSVLAVFLDRRVWLMCWIFFACAMGQYALTFWMPTLIKTAGIKSMFERGLGDRNSLPGDSRHHGAGRRQRGPSSRAALASGGAHGDWGGRPHPECAGRNANGARCFLSLDCGGGSDYFRAAVLELAHRVSFRSRSRRGNRSDQFSGQSGWIREPLYGGLARRT